MAAYPVSSLNDVEFLVQEPDAHRVVRIDAAIPLRDAEKMVKLLVRMARDYGWSIDRRNLFRLKALMTLDLHLKVLSRVAIVRLYREPLDPQTIWNTKRVGFDIQSFARICGGSIMQAADEVGDRARVIAAQAYSGELNIHEVMSAVVALLDQVDTVRELAADFRVGPEPHGPRPPPLVHL